MRDFSVLIVNYRTEEHVVAAITGLRALPGEEAAADIVVVDNSPERGLEARLASFVPPVAYRASETNVGFAAGVNLGWPLTRRAIVVLLNPDARPAAGCLAGLCEVLGRRPSAAVAGPRLIPFERGRSPVPSATRRDPGLLAPLVEYTPLRRLVARDWLTRRYYLGPDDVNEPTPCAMVQGACFAVKREWVDRVGPFDASRFFLYWEETDFCRRVRGAGGEVLYCPDLICEHLGGASLEEEGGQDVVQFWRSFYAFQAKHEGVLRAGLLWSALTAGLLCEYLLCLMKCLPRGAGASPELVRYLAQVRRRLAFHLGRTAR